MRFISRENDLAYPSTFFKFQIAMKSGVIQRLGLVEFSTSSEAEMTQQLLNGHLINGKPIRVQVCSSLIWENHRDLSIHIERTCQLHGAIMTQHGL